MPTPSERPDAPRGPTTAADPAARALPRPRRALALLAEALCAAAPSKEAVRDAAVRYGSAARALAVAPEEMTAALGAILRRCTERHAPALRAELETSVPWWAIHGYHRAD